MAVLTHISSGTDLAALAGTKISSSGGTSGSGSSSGTGSNSAADQAEKLKNQFLNILLTQMQHQNPLDPMDTKEFTGQLAQFSSLEQQISTNTKLDTLASSLKQTAIANSFSYIGQSVELASDTTSLQSGSADWTYALPKEAASVDIKITDAKGVTVYSGSMKNSAGSGDMAAGTYQFSLAGADLPSSLPDGSVLKMSMTAKDSTGAAITPQIHTTVKVDSLQSDSSGTYLQAGGILFEIGDVQKIVNAPSTNSTTTATATSTAAT